MNGNYLAKIESIVVSYKFLILVIIGLFLIRLPSLLEPLWYGDEAIYLTIGQEINRGGLLYVDAFDHKTPGIYYLAAWSMKLLGETIWSFKFLLAVWLVPTLIAFHYLTNFLFDKKTAILSTLILALFLATPMFEGNIVNSEILMILPTSIAIILGLKKRYFLSGIFFSLALLLKFPAIFDFGAFFIFLALTFDQRHYLVTIKNLVRLTLGLAIPFGLTFVYFASQGALAAYINNAFLFNLTYTNYGNEFIIPNGLLVVKALPLFTVFVYFLWRVFTDKGRRFGTKVGYSEFLIIWLVFSYYGTVFGGRTYIHYLIQPIAPLAIILGRSISTKEFRRLGLTVVGITLILTVALGFLPLRGFPYFNPLYYLNFTRFALNNTSVEEYQNSFDPNTARNYSIASLLQRSDPEDTIYLWANQPSIYFLADRRGASKYITAFHVTGSDPAKKEVVQDLRKNEPKYIVVDGKGPSTFPELDTFIHSRYNLFAISENFLIYELNQNNKTL